MNHLYFAYGSNMNPDRISERIPQARVVGKAYIKGWTLKERLYADIERKIGGRVEGVLYLITESELHRLDAYEGYPTTYQCVGVNAYLDEKHKVHSFTYMMTEKARAAREGKPYPMGYRLMCSYGARFHKVADSFGRAGDPPYRTMNCRLKLAENEKGILDGGMDDDADKD